MKSIQNPHAEFPDVINQKEGRNYKLYHADCVDIARSLPDDSIHYSIYSPPFESLYTYSNSERDMGNSKDSETFWEHYKFLIKETARCMMPGRLVSVHCMNLPTSKSFHGFIGLRDFRGEIIRAFVEAGFIYHSEVCIWKDPVAMMQRTKALGLLHKQILKDSCMSRQAIPDYLVTFRKPGENPERVGGPFKKYVGDEKEMIKRAAAIGLSEHEADQIRFSIDVWQRYADPTWEDIDQSNTLNRECARDEKDERHICPLQLDVIARGIQLWSNPGDIVWSPFAGIASEGYQALKMGRKYVGSELKESYFRQGCLNLHDACNVEIELPIQTKRKGPPPKK